MERDKLYEAEHILSELENSKAPLESIQKLKEIFNPLFEKEREKEYKEKLKIEKYSWSNFDPHQQLQIAVQNLSSVMTYHYEAKAEEEKFHDATQDLLHAFELTEPTDEDLIELGKELRTLRKQRRKTKDFLTLTEPLFNFVVKNKQLIKELGQVQGEMTRISKTLDGRKYYTKEKTSLQEAFDKAKENEKKLVTA